MAAWPATLPSPKVDGYSLSPADQTVRTDMEVGLPRVRRRTAARNDQVKLQWHFTDTQMAAFRTWFDDAAEAAGGAAWFTIGLPIGTTGMASVEARFVGAWQAELSPPLRWDVSATVEVR